MSGRWYTIVVGVVALVATGCGSSSATARDGGGGHGGSGVDGAAGEPAHDAAVDQRFWDGAGTEGAIHVLWALESADASPTDCISSKTSNIKIDFTNASQIPILSRTDYCVDMQETVGGFVPGEYSIQLSLTSNIDGSVAAMARGTATVRADAVAETGTLTLKVTGP